MRGGTLDEVTGAVEVAGWRRGVEFLELFLSYVFFVVESSHLLGLREEHLLFGQPLAFLLLQRLYALDA